MGAGPPRVRATRRPAAGAPIRRRHRALRQRRRDVEGAAPALAGRRLRGPLLRLRAARRRQPRARGPRLPGDGPRLRRLARPARGPTLRAEDPAQGARRERGGAQGPRARGPLPLQDPPRQHSRGPGLRHDLDGRAPVHPRGLVRDVPRAASALLLAVSLSLSRARPSRRRDVLRAMRLKAVGQDPAERELAIQAWPSLERLRVLRELAAAGVRRRERLSCVPGDVRNSDPVV